jgi:hypothetical protein
MANLFTRHHNDVNDTIMFNKSNSSYYSIVSDNKVAENTTSCYATVGLPNAKSQISRPMKNNGELDIPTLVDIETKIQNRHKELNSEERNNKDYSRVSISTPTTCTSKETMTSEDTRFTNPIVNYREMNTTEYKYTPYLFVDMQKAVYDNTEFLSPTRNGVSSRFESKREKYDYKPKEFATVKPESYYTELYSGLMPKKMVNTPAYKYSFPQ